MILLPTDMGFQLAKVLISAWMMPKIGNPIIKMPQTENKMANNGEAVNKFQSICGITSVKMAGVAAIKPVATINNDKNTMNKINKTGAALTAMITSNALIMNPATLIIACPIFSKNERGLPDLI